MGRLYDRRVCENKDARICFTLECWSVHKECVQQQGDLDREILKGVSRSFYLSLRLLPRLMQGPLSLGYLLARASDTIADSEEVDVTVRVQCLSMFEAAMLGGEARKELIKLLEKKFVTAQNNPKERMLLERLNDIFAWYDSSWEWVWSALQQLMQTIVRGQAFDLERFAKDGGGKIQSGKELMEYCYMVAGSVGEYWTEVGYRTDSSFSSMKREKLEAFGISFGQGLQLVNILRDAPVDMHEGRIYLPNANVAREAELIKEAKRWRKRARTLVQKGYVYSKSLRQKRSRIAVALPALLADETLNLLDKADLEDWQKGVKVSRKTVRRCVIRAALGRY